MNWGGQEYRTVLETLWLNANNHQAWIACHPDSQLFIKGHEYGVPMIPMDFSKSYLLGTTRACYRFCKAHKIDVINTHSSRDSILCMPLNYLHFPVVRSRQITNPIKKSLSYKIGCRKILATAEVIKSMLISKGVNAEKIEVIGEGIDLKEYSPSVDSTAFRKEFSLSPNTPLVINIGMIRGDKGQRYFLESARKVLKIHPNVIYLLVGEANKDKQLEIELNQLIKNYSLENNFKMIGYREDIPEIIAASSIVIVASTGTEAQSRIVPQAFASRKAVIATKVGGLPELVKERETGLLVPPANPEAMAEATISLLDNTELKNKLAENAYIMAQEKLSFSYMMEKTLKLYQKAKKLQS
jgi:glycosyltransferase involved in cell wall biosynthesis